MNKVEVGDMVASKLSLSKRQGEEAVDAVFDAISTALSKGEEVAISGFGSFRVSSRAARSGVNPRTGEKIQIAATKTPKFRAGKSLKDAVK